MQLKNAVAVCLISLFAATLVVLIARALDMQAASRIEPQLAEILDELRAIRHQTSAAEERLVVYFFHRKERCVACIAIEKQTKRLLETTFADEWRRGAIAWKMYDFQQPIAAPLVEQFDVQPPVVVLAKMRGERLLDWKRLDDVMSLYGDKPAFAEYVGGELRRMLGTGRDAATPKGIGD